MIINLNIILGHYTRKSLCNNEGNIIVSCIWSINIVKEKREYIVLEIWNALLWLSWV